jgi:lipoprotein LprG
MRIHKLLTLYIAVLLLTLSGCGSGAPTPTPIPTPTPGELIAQAGLATQQAQTLHFMIELSGQPITTDSTGLFTIRSMVGDVQRPDGALATLTVRSAIGVAEIRTVSLAGKQYLSNPVTRQWQCLAPGTAFDPSVLFDPQRGIGALFQQGVEQPVLLGNEDLAGRSTIHLRGTIAAAPLQAISAGLLGAGPVQLDLWADTQTKQIVQLVLIDTATDPAAPSTWTILFSDYDKPVDVRAPVECT